MALFDKRTTDRLPHLGGIIGAKSICFLNSNMEDSISYLSLGKIGKEPMEREWMGVVKRLDPNTFGFSGTDRRSFWILGIRAFLFSIDINMEVKEDKKRMRSH